MENTSSSQQQLTLRLLIRFLGGLSAYKLPTQAQLSNILLATLHSPLFHSAHPDQQPHLIRSLARLLATTRTFTDLTNHQDQYQRLIYALLTQKSHASIPATLSTSVSTSTVSPTLLLKKLLWTSLQIPKDTFQIIDNGLKLIIEFFQNQSQTTTLQTEDQKSQTNQQIIDRLVTELVKFLVKLHHHLGDVLKDQVHDIYQALSKDLESFQVNQEFWDIIHLFSQCLCTFFGTTSYWDQLIIPFNQLTQLFTENKDELLKPLKKLQDVILNLFHNFDQELYSPKLYENLRLILEELQVSGNLMAKPTKEIIEILEAMRLRAMKEDQSWRELVDAFEQVSSDFINSIHLDSSLPYHLTGSVAKATFHTTLEYLIPRLLLLMNEIPSPRIEYVSPTIDAVFDPASFISTSGFLPSSIFSTTVLRFEVNKKPTTQEETNVRQLNESPTPSKNNNQLYVKQVSKQRISISGLRVMSKNVGFYFHKKANSDKNYLSKTFDFTHFEDEGQLDIFLGMGDEDGLSLDFQLNWIPYHPSTSTREEKLSDQHSDHRNLDGNHLNRKKSVGLFTVENFKVDLKGFGIFPHNTNHPVLNWFLKPGLEPYLHDKLIRVITEYLLDELRKLNELLGKMREKWEEGVETGKSRWERFMEMMQVMNRDEEENDDEQPGSDSDPGTTSKMDGYGMTIRAEDDSYAIRIGFGHNNFLPGKGLPGPARFQERLTTITHHVADTIDTKVKQIAHGIAQATIQSDQPGWQSTIFDFD